MSLPYFQFMVDDWLSGLICTHDMETQAVFLNLCARIWKAGGSIPDDDDRNARLLRVDRQMLSNCLARLKQDSLLLVDGDGMLRVKFIDSQIARQVEVSLKRSAAGRKGGKANAKQVLSKREAFLEPDPEPKKKSSAFAPPIIEQLNEYAASKGWKDFDAEAFVDHYAGNGWKVGRNAMKSWQHTANKSYRDGWTRKPQDELPYDPRPSPFNQAKS